MFTPDTVQFEDRDGNIILGPFDCKYESKSQNSTNQDGGTTQTSNCEVMVGDLLTGIIGGHYMKVSNNGRALGDYMVDKIDPFYLRKGFHHNLVYGKLAE